MPVIRFSSLLLLILVSYFASAQTFTALRDSNMINASNGYYEYLPQGYNPAASTVYPLIIFLHGQEDLGNGDTDLDLLLTKALPKVIDDQLFPTSFTVGGQTHRFIILCPQFINDGVDQPSPEEVDEIIDFAIDKYKINQNRIYITGLSLGGGATWEYAGDNATYANRIAGIVPVAGFSAPTTARAQIMATANLPVWATHNNGDPTATVNWTNGYVDLINSFNPNPLAKKTIFISPLHEGWTTTYDPNFEEDGLSIYEWMLQYQRPIVALPVLLTGYKAVANGSSVVVSWSTSNELNNAFFTIERSGNGVDFSAIGKVTGLNQPNNYTFTDAVPLNGDNYYRLSQTDADGRTTYYQILKVNILKSASSSISIRPNPVISNIEIKFSTVEIGLFQFSVLNTAGIIVKQWKTEKAAPDFTQTFQLSGLPEGVYILRVQGKTFQQSVQFIKK